MDISLNVVLLIFGLGGASCILYGINSARASHRLDVEIKHQEYEDNRADKHQENMAQIVATRDSEIAKYAAKPAPKQIEG
jgi:hypothetical protein